MKKLISLLISISLLLSFAVPFSAYAQEEMYNSETAYVSPSDIEKVNGKTYYSMGLELYNYVKTKLENRVKSFDIPVIVSEPVETDSKRDDIVLEAYMGASFDGISNNPSDGDYALWAVEDFKAVSAVRDAEKGGKYCYTVKAEFSYYETAAEEIQVDNAVSAFLDAYDINGKTDVQIIKGVHDFICSKNTYDSAAAVLPSKHLYAFSPYGALVNGSSVCQGYALAFYRLCRELGYSVRFVSSNPNFGAHAWNIIALDGKYYTVDCMWNDRYLDGADRSFPKDYFFLTDGESAQAYDNLGEHKLYNSLYSNTYFETNYKNRFASSPYTAQYGLLSACTVTLSGTEFTCTSKEIKPSVKITFGGKTLEEGTDYSVKYSSNAGAGIGRIDITGLGGFEGTSAHRQFKITPSKAGKPYAVSVKAKSLRLAWGKAENASGYEVQRLEKGKWIAVYDTAKTAATVKSLKPNTVYKFRIRAYKKVNRRKIYSAAGSASALCTKPAKAKIKAVYSENKGFTVKRKAVKSTGFQVQYSLNKSFKGAKTVKAKSGTAKTVKGLKSGRKYYVRIRAFRKYKNENGKVKTVFGVWSAKKSVKTQ